MHLFLVGGHCRNGLDGRHPQVAIQVQTFVVVLMEPIIVLLSMELDESGLEVG